MGVHWGCWQDPVAPAGPLQAWLQLLLFPHLNSGHGPDRVPSQHGSWSPHVLGVKMGSPQCLGTSWILPSVSSLLEGETWGKYKSYRQRNQGLARPSLLAPVLRGSHLLTRCSHGWTPGMSTFLAPQRGLGDCGLLRQEWVVRFRVTDSASIAAPRLLTSPC